MDVSSVIDQLCCCAMFKEKYGLRQEMQRTYKQKNLLGTSIKQDLTQSMKMFENGEKIKRNQINVKNEFAKLVLAVDVFLLRKMGI